MDSNANSTPEVSAPDPPPFVIIQAKARQRIRMKAIPYGLSDFKRVLEEEYYYIDKTMFIPLIEEYGNFLYLIRPRRFGKSLFLNMLDFYYNRIYEKDFELFKECYIYNNPTKLKNSFCVMKFDFSAYLPKGMWTKTSAGIAIVESRPF